jgi:hypothetical protein
MAKLKPLRAEHVGADIWKYPQAFSPELCTRIREQFDRDDRKSYKHRRRLRSYFDNRQGQMLFVSDLAEWKELDREIYEAITRIISSHFERYRYFTEFTDEGYEVGCYLPPKEGCSEHFDAGNRSSRVASIVVYLNDVAKGGETVFPRQEIEIAPEEGMAIVFPPFYTHPHFARPPESGPRYFLVTWANTKKSV